MVRKFLKDKGQEQIAWFVIKAFLLYILWFISYDYFIPQDGSVNTWLNHRVAVDASVLLRIIGLDAGTIPGNHQTVVLIANEGMVGVGNPCNGLELFALFAGFIICFPGKLKPKLWFIPIGLLLIHFINVLRTMSLALIQYKAPEYLEFNHHYTFTVIVYALIFFLWMLWVNRYSGFTMKQSDKKES